MFTKVCFILSVVLFISVLSESNPTVRLPSGILQGEIKTSNNGTSFYSFEGVPYASPPIGKYRFEAPQPVKHWNGVRSARTIYKCLQYRHLKPTNKENPLTGSEDCLYLNIYTPTLDLNANLDVIVFIHGGAFMFNYGGFQRPDILLNNDVVYINLNYRLGPLGFLSTEDDVVPGNNGLKDQIAAFKFIRDNVQYFGGNPNSVTITGNSAGAASVHFHYMIAKSKGLFHKGISQSGSALNPWVIMENPLVKTKKIASHLGCPAKKTKQMVQCLKRKSGRKIVKSVKLFQVQHQRDAIDCAGIDMREFSCCNVGSGWSKNIGKPWMYNPFSPFGVVVDSWATSPLLPEHPYMILKKKLVYPVPWIASHVNSEGLYPVAEYYSDEKYLKTIDKRWNKIIPHILHYAETIDDSKLSEVSANIREFYLGDKPLNRSTYNEFVQMVGDRLFVVDIHKAVKLHAQATLVPTYLYYFTYRGQSSRSDLRSQSKSNFGAAHGDDLSYIVQTNLNTTSNEKDRSMSDLLVNMWMSVATSGNPDIFPNVDWLAVDKESNRLNYLKISSPEDISMESDEKLGNKQFWDSIPFRENENLYIHNFI